MTNMSNPPSDYLALAENFSLLPDGDERLRFLIDLGRQLPPLEESEQNEENLVRGCVSSVWLLCEKKISDTGGTAVETLHFRGQSDALIVTGIVSIVLSRFTGLSPEEVISCETDSILEGFDLQHHLSTGRQNGLAAMVERIRQFAVRALVPEDSACGSE